MKNIFVKLSTFLLIVLWVYAAISKLLDFGHFELEMHRQTLSPLIQFLLIWFLPPIELFAALLLSFEKTIKAGLYLSLIMMAFFSGYIALVLLNFFERIPCSCGGILEKMGWTTHLIFNLCYLTLILSTLFVTKKKGGAKAY